MDIYLVRHAIADNRHPERYPNDAARPLTEEGIARFRAAARGLRRIVPEVEVVLSSPYTRAWETAELLHEESGWPAPEACSPLEADQPAAAALEILAERKDRSSIALVGHEPYMSNLASLLLHGNEDAVHVEFKKGGVALIGFVGEPRRGEGSLRWSLSPKILRALDPS